MKLEKIYDDRYVLQSTFNSMGLSFKDIIDIHSMIETQLKEMDFYFNYER